HNIGVDTFDKKFHLENSWIKVDDKLNAMLKGVKDNSNI
ncbi:putative HNHc nuclease, partial [Staphylococcus capitis subsp. urealyticus]